MVSIIIMHIWFLPLSSLSQLVDGHTLFDYDVGLNEIIQIYVSPAQVSNHGNKTTPTDQQTNGADSNDEAMETVSQLGFIIIIL